MLYRTSRQAEILAEVLFRQGIPYQVVDLDPFYHKGQVKILYLWTLVAAGLADLSHLLFLLGLEHGIGKATLTRVERALYEKADEPSTTLAALTMQSGKVKKSAAIFQDLAEQIRLTAENSGVAASMTPVLERYDITEDEVEVRRFLRLAGALGSSLTEFGDYLLKNSRFGVYDEQAEAVTLMTLHAAKGKEFPVVFLVGLEEGQLPLQPREQLTESKYLLHIEEERRLFFVGLTRAKFQLYLSWSGQEKGNRYERNTSRFIGEIPESLLLRTLPKKVKRSKHKQLSLFS